MKNNFLLIVLFGFALWSCKSKKALTTSETTLQETRVDTVGIKYRVIISFLSKGAGTDVSKRDSVLNFIDQHSKKPLYKTVLWGREGETDYCLILNELSKHEQTLFIDDIKEIIAGSELILVTENAENYHKGR